MPRVALERKRTPLGLVMVMMGLVIVLVPLNLYSVAIHPGESPFWVAMMLLGSILLTFGTGLMICDRFARRP
jgi:hypothetical protein